VSIHEVVNNNYVGKELFFFIAAGRKKHNGWMLQVNRVNIKCDRRCWGDASLSMLLLFGLWERTCMPFKKIKKKLKRKRIPFFKNIRIYHHLLFFFVFYKSTFILPHCVLLANKFYFNHQFKHDNRASWNNASSLEKILACLYECWTLLMLLYECLWKWDLGAMCSSVFEHVACLTSVPTEALFLK